MGKAKIHVESVTIPTYRAGEPEKLPLFIEKRAYQGSTGKVYPLPVTEWISDEKEDISYEAVILENDYLYVMILPELGGRIQRALDKTNGYDFIYYNHVIKPALVGLAGPWISGGIEFNWPQHHRPSTFMPVDYVTCENPDGSVTVTLGETDRMNGTKGNAAITLYPEKAYIEIRGRLFNPTDYPQTFLWWANPAVSVNEHTFSVFPPDVNAVMDHGKRAVSTFPIATGEYYKADYSEGVDISRYKNIRVPTSYMAAHSDFDFVGNFDESRDAGLLHVADHHISPGKKQWTWGCGDFGRMWGRNLTDADGPYIELMTGVFCDNQPDFTWLKPREEKNFVQYFMPYKTVGRVSNATRDVLIGVTLLDEHGLSIESGPYVQEECSSTRGLLKVYATGKYPDATVTVCSGTREIYRRTVDLSPEAAFTDTVDGLTDYSIRVCDAAGQLLCEYKAFRNQSQPIPDPAQPLPPPDQIGSLEELYLAGQHLEQYRHATYLPSDYYLEGLKRDPTDIRLNNAYGLLLLRSGEIERSIPFFQAAIRKQTRRNPNPYSGESYFNLGLAQRLAGRLGEAEDAFYKATWSAETANAAWFHLACLAVRRGDLDQALHCAQESLHRGWHDMKTRSLIAAILEHKGASAEAFLQESCRIDPLYGGIQARLLGWQRYAESSGKRVENALNTAYEYLTFGFPEDAIGVLQACPAEHPMKHYTLAAACLRLERKAEALNHALSAESLPGDRCFPNRIEEMLILQQCIDLLEDAGKSAPMAHCYLGELFYDKRQYEQAIAHWNQTVRQKPDLALAWRNLSIAQYNHGDRSLAKAAIFEACRLEPLNSRLLLERDQLLKRLEAPAQERLALLEKVPSEVIRERYALMLAYVSLLNANGYPEKALELMSGYTFHVWEGGEGKVADEYKAALFALAEKEMAKGTAESYAAAVRLAKRTLSYPENLGEGKLDNVPDNRAYYVMGCALRKLGHETEAVRCFEKAAEGSQIPEIVRYYNDQPSDYIYYQGLAFHALGEDRKAKKSFHQLIIFGERHLFDKVGYDFFAVSMPELEVYEDDIQKRSDDYCRRLIALGKKGLAEIEAK